MLPPVRVLITGGAGFIGANLARHLTVAHEVVVLDDLSTGSRRNLEGVPVTFLEGSILDRDALDEAVAGADGVVHLAARPSVPRSIADPIASHHANATGTLELLEAVRRAEGRASVVLASSSSVYGSNPKLPRAEHDTPMPMSPYAVSKLATEQYALSHRAAFGLDVLPFRFFNVFGPLQAAGHAYAAVIPAFLEAALAGKPLPLQGDGLQTRDFTFVDTVCEVITRAVEERTSVPTPVNLAFGSRVSLLDLIALLGEVLGHELEVEHLPPRVGDVRDSQADQTLLKATFPGLVPVDLRTGLEATLAWFRQEAS
jgi:UDP-glucose 4-epimerase